MREETVPRTSGPANPQNLGKAKDQTCLDDWHSSQHICRLFDKCQRWCIPWTVYSLVIYQCFSEGLQSAKQRWRLEEAWTRSCRTSRHTCLQQRGDTIKQSLEVALNIRESKTDHLQIHPYGQTKSVGNQPLAGLGGFVTYRSYLYLFLLWYLDL